MRHAEKSGKILKVNPTPVKSPKVSTTRNQTPKKELQLVTMKQKHSRNFQENRRYITIKEKMARKFGVNLSQKHI